jgi:hypothetical protein
MYIKKWLFKDFKEDVVNYNYYKTVPFCTFSDIKNPNYPLIEETLDYMGYNKDTFVSIGKTTAPFGISVNPLNVKSNNELLNSCQMSFIFDESIDSTPFIIKSVLAGIMPIHSEEYMFSKKLGISKYSTVLSPNNIIFKIKEILDKGNIFQYDIYWKSWNYHNQVKKWKNNE